VTATVPGLTAPRRPRTPAVAEAVIGSGLRVIAVRKPAVPLAEIRLRIPFASARSTHPARAALLAESLLAGTDVLERAGIAAAVQSLGADLHVSVDAERLLVSGNTLAGSLRPLLDLLASVLVGAAYPRGEVATERDRLVERLSIARSRPGVIAAEALSRRMWGSHPYALDLPQPDAVASVTPAALRTLHTERVRPAGATLVVVGDVSATKVIDLVAAALDDWRGAEAEASLPVLPHPAPGPTLVIDRPGSVQSSIRFGGPAVPRADADYPALQLANLIFGGYFSSRWTENLREDKGYTYGPHSRIEHYRLGSALLFDIDVATEVTAPAMLETRYELGRIASLPVTAAEVDAVRQYAIGTLALSTATQAGLAGTLTALAVFGLGVEWIAEHPRRLARVGVDEVSAAAARFFAPAQLVEVIVGDAATITEPLRALGGVTGAA
jgi:predicted Zn-dependent peptidase